MNQPLNSRQVVLVTGASRGIGRSIAMYLARNDWSVALAGRDEEALAAAAQECTSSGADVMTLLLDVRDPTAVAAAVKSAEDRLGPVTALVNNAGAQRVGPALDLAPDDLDTILDTNLKGAFLCAQAVVRRLVERGEAGAVVNVASAAALVGTTDRAAYAASKAGLVMLTRTLAREWAPHRIRVNAVAPTFVDTELGRQTLADPETYRSVISAIPLGRVATYDDILPTVGYLLNESQSGFVTGQVIAVDGGLSA